MAKLCEHGYFLEVAPRSCPKCRTDCDLIQREEIATLRASIAAIYVMADRVGVETIREECLHAIPELAAMAGGEK